MNLDLITVTSGKTINLQCICLKDLSFYVAVLQFQLDLLCGDCFMSSSLAFHRRRNKANNTHFHLNLLNAACNAYVCMFVCLDICNFK